MTAAKVMDVFARQTYCDGQAADAVSAYTQVKMEDAPKSLRIQKSGCPDIWIRLPRHKWPKSWEKFEHPVALLERNCTVIHYLDCHGKGDVVKDDSGAYAVCNEQGSSASQMTAAKVMDVIARLPDCDGQAADAVSAYTQVKMEDVPKLLRISKSGCPDMWRRLPRHKWPKSWSNIEDPVVPLERNMYGHPLAGLLRERQFEKILLKHGWEKFPNWECIFVHRGKGIFLSVCVDDIKLAGKKQNIDPMWKVFNGPAVSS